MNLKTLLFRVKGINKDTGKSVFPADYAYDIKNLRITPTDNNTGYIWSNIKGTSEVSIEDLLIFEGTVVGVNSYLDDIIVFTSENVYLNIDDYELTITDIIDTTSVADIKDITNDSIYLLSKRNNTYTSKLLFKGILNLSSNNPIESIVFYENNEIIKLYWADGINPLRILNIKTNSTITTSDYVNLIPLLPLISVNIKKNFSLGSFAPGVIQYLITAYNKYALESNIIYYSPLYYISSEFKGEDAESKVNNSFTININISLDIGVYSNLKVYSIHRTSLDATPISKVVFENLNFENGSYIDDGSKGYTITPTDLLYLNKEQIIPYTMAVKNNTLFLGNWKTNLKGIPEENKKIIREYYNDPKNSNLITFSYLDSEEDINNIGDKSLTLVDRGNGYTEYSSEYNSLQLKGFKGGEYYHIGIQLRDKVGTIIDTIYIKTILNPIYPKTVNNKVYLPRIKFIVPYELFPMFKSTASFRVVYSCLNSIVCLGVLNPTVYNLGERVNNRPFAMSSWITRPISIGNSKSRIFLHDAMIPDNHLSNSEILGIIGGSAPIYLEELTLYTVYVKFVFSHPPGFDNYSAFIFTYGNSIDGDVSTRYSIIVALSVSDAYNDAVKWMLDIGITIPPLSMEDWMAAGLSGRTESKSYSESDLGKKYLSQNKSYYFVDLSILTLNSPDINIDSVISSNNSMRIVGLSPVKNIKSSFYINSEAPYNNIYSGVSSLNKLLYTSHNTGVLAVPIYNDIIDSSLKPDIANNNFIYTTYMWHRDTYLNNIKQLNLDAKSYGKLLKKVFSNLVLNSSTSYCKNVSNSILYNYYNLDNSELTINMFTSVNDLLVLSKDANSKMDNLNYSGNYNNILSITNVYNNIYPIVGLKIDTPSDLVDIYEKTSYIDSGVYVLDPISITYKSSPHLILLLNKSETGKYNILPKLLIGDLIYNLYDKLYSYPWGDYKLKNKSITTVKEEKSFDLSYEEFIEQIDTLLDEDLVMWLVKLNNSKGCVVIKIGEVARVVLTDTWVHVESDNSYYDITPGNGGPDLTKLDSKPSASYKLGANLKIFNSLILNNLEFNINMGVLYIADIYNTVDTNIYDYSTIQWIPSGDFVQSKYIYDITLYGLEGDTYYLRYDCLKTFPYSSEDKNQVVDICSFMCETKTNLLGRYDNNKNKDDNTGITDLNFNLINPVYSQSNNFFNFRELKDYIDTEHSSSVLWSRPKVQGSLIDTWTDINTISSLDLSGNLGTLNKLEIYNNKLIAFLEDGISEILYGNRNLMTTAEGLPVEIANSTKVDGYYIWSDSYGCLNKWSLVSTDSGIYFYDNKRKNILLLTGDSIKELSTSLGVSSLISSNTSIWNPIDFNNIKASVDLINKEILFINKEYCLVYSEKSGTFTSIYDYGNTSYIVNMDDTMIHFRNEENSQYTIWKDDSYNYIYGEYKPYYMEFISKGEDGIYDKIFTNVNLNCDVFNSEYLPDELPFDSIEVSNEYQHNKLNLVYNKVLPSNTKKKFRTWRILIPRDKNGRDRIRNPWVSIKLSKELENINKTLLHNISVDYYL